MPILLNAVRDPEKKACAVSKSYRWKLVRAGIGRAAAYRGVLEASTSLPKERYAVSNDSLVKLIQPDLPLNFHPAAVRVSGFCTPCGAGGATGDRRSWSGLRSRSPVAVNVAA
jgi:hypothetical protein